MKKILAFFKRLFSFKKKVTEETVVPEIEQIPLVEDVVEELPVELVEETIEQPEEVKPTIFKQLTNTIDNKVELIKEKVNKPTEEKTIGDIVFKKYHRGLKVGQFGVIAFIDGKDGRIELGRSSKLNDYLSGISSSTISAGRYGRGLQDMKKIEVYFYEVNDKDSVLKTYSSLNKMIYK